MSKSTKTLIALCMVAFVAACGANTASETVYVDEAAPVSVEPTYTGKYK